MKTTTFHYFAQLAREYLDFEELGLDPELTPLDYFVRTHTQPTKRQINKLVETYDLQQLKVKVKGSNTPVDIRQAVEAMGDTLGVEAPKEGNRGKGRPPVSKVMDLSPLSQIVLKYNFRLRDLADLANMYPSALSVTLRGPTRVTPQRCEVILEAAQMLFTGNPAALKELRKFEKGLDQ